MLLNDYIQVAQAGFARLRTRAGAIIAGRDFADDKSVIEVRGWVSLVCRERGKIVPGTHRSSHNIWTNTGREYLAMLMAIKDNVLGNLSYYRSDRMAYIGVGTGSQLETPSVVGLVEPVEYVAGQYLASIDLPDFPLYPTRTTVRFHRTFLENQITLSGGSRVNISEMGLFTNGDPTSNPPFQSPVDLVAGRSTTIGDAALQSPMAYKTFEPIGKTDAMQLEVSWEIRF
jgi:hypothetical protein